MTTVEQYTGLHVSHDLNSHKTMQPGEVVTDLSSFLEGAFNIESPHIDFNTGTQGGLIFDRHNKVVAAVRPPIFRPVENNPDVTAGDVKRVHSEPNPNVRLEQVHSGGELEMYAWNPVLQEISPIAAPGSRVLEDLHNHNNGVHFEEEDPFSDDDTMTDDERKVGFSEELATNCVELNFNPSPSSEKRAVTMVYALQKLATISARHGALLTPIAAFPHRPLDLQDTNPDPYVQRIAMKYMGWERVQHFVGSSYQVHVENLEPEAALKTINLLQEVAPLVHSLSLAAPFINGQVFPDLANNYTALGNDSENPIKGDTYSALQDYESITTQATGHKPEWLSVRYFGRYFGSPQGGVMPRPIPDTEEGYWQHVHTMMKNSDIPSSGRGTGNHTDFRFRPDIGPVVEGQPSCGTTEISYMDTFAGDPVKLASVQEFLKVMTWKLQIYAMQGRLSEVHTQYPALFSAKPTEQRFTDVHFNTMNVSAEGVNAVVKGADGKDYRAGDLLKELFAFVNEPLVDETQGVEFNSLPTNVLNELKLSASVPTQQDYNQFTDETGVVSMEGFYKTGKGTASHWLLERAKGLMDQGYSEQDAIKDCMTNLGESYHTHLAGLTKTSITQLFSH
jgi:hypothetical protein